MIKHLLENHEGNVHLIGCGQLYSAGLMTMMITNVSKDILPDSVGMWHVPYVEGRILTHPFSIAQDAETMFYKKSLEPITNYMENLLKPTKSEKNILDKGRELYIDVDRLRKMLIASKEEPFID